MHKGFKHDEAAPFFDKLVFSKVLQTFYRTCLAFSGNMTLCCFRLNKDLVAM